MGLVVLAGLFQIGCHLRIGMASCLVVGTCLRRVGPVYDSSGRNQVHVAAAFLSLYIFVYALDI